MIKKALFPLTLTSIFSLQACQTNDAYTGQQKTASATTGAIVGGIAGAILGNQVKGSKNKKRNARLAGATLGALAGGGYGHKLDQEEKELRQKLQNTGVSVTRNGEQIILNMPGSITFETAKARIKPDFLPVLKSVAKVLKRYQGTSVEIAGHTDSIGTAADNQILSEQRAKGVSQVLRRNGISRGRIAHYGFGESQPVDSNKTKAGRKNNRRVEITLAPAAY